MFIEKKRLLVFVVCSLFISLPLTISLDINIKEVSRDPYQQAVVDEPLSYVDRAFIITRYVFGPKLNVADISDGNLVFIYHDRGKTTRLRYELLSANSKVFNFLPFGQGLREDSTRYSFATDKELDNSKLYYFNARYLDPNLGRFTSVDPNKDGNAYVYVNNNPVQYVDRDGRIAETVADVAFLGWSLWDMYEEPSWKNAGWVAVDVGSIIIPFAAFGVGRRAYQAKMAAKASLASKFKITDEILSMKPIEVTREIRKSVRTSMESYRMFAGKVKGTWRSSWGYKVADIVFDPSIFKTADGGTSMTAVNSFTNKFRELSKGFKHTLKDAQALPGTEELILIDKKTREIVANLGHVSSINHYIENAVKLVKNGDMKGLEKMWNQGATMTGYKSIDKATDAMASVGKTAADFGVDPGDLFKNLGN